MRSHRSHRSNHWGVGQPTIRPRKRGWLAALIIGAMAGGSAAAFVTHEQNNIPSHCTGMGTDGLFHRAC